MIISRTRCPFCASWSLKTRPTYVGRPGDPADESYKFVHVFCEGCGAYGPSAQSDGDAITLWNRRASL